MLLLLVLIFAMNCCNILRLCCVRIQILLNIEHRLMSQAAAPCDYETLSIMQKVEVFEMSLKHTAGQDLYKVPV